MIWEVHGRTEWRMPVQQRAQSEIDRLLGLEQLDLGFRVQMLAQALITRSKTYAQTGDRPSRPSGLRKLIEEGKLNEFFADQQRNYLNPLHLNHSPLDLKIFPLGSWAIQFTFILRKPYISKDDTDFYILDNPVKKEWVFKVPYVAPSQWKGALRAAMMRDLVSDLQTGQKDEEQFVTERLRLYRLFGNEKDGSAEFLNRAWALHRVGPRPETDDADQHNAWEQRFRAELKAVSEKFEKLLRDRGYRIGDVEGFQGCLYFYPTYFDRIGLEVINPHPRDTGAGKQPIYFECVPAGTTGTFTLLYVPLTGSEKDPEEIKREATSDLQVIAAGLHAMFTLYGFGAKTSSGYGLAKEEFDKDEQGNPQAIVRIKDGKEFHCHSFTDLRQKAKELAEERHHGT